MNRYESYKEVNLPWLKEVPSHWGVKKIRHIFEERKEKNVNGKEGFVLSVLKEIGVIPYREKGSIGNKASENIENYKMVYKDDIVLNSMNMMIGSLGKSSYKGVLSHVYYVLKLNKKEEVDINYLEYVFKNSIFYESFRVLGKGILDHRLRVPMEALKYEHLPIPSLQEQTQIAGYLDWKISEIDRLIAKEKEKIRELELILFRTLNLIYEQIEDYELVSLKRVSSVYSGKEVLDEVEKNKNSFPVYGSGDKIFKYTSKYLLDGKYIIFGRKGTIGKPYIIDGKFWIVDTAYAITNNERITFDYLYYILKIFKWGDFTTNTVKPSIVANQIIQSKIKLPTIDIQNDITDKIVKLENGIKYYTNLTKTQIQNLQSLKQSLISEVVTGQIDVRDVVIPKHEKFTLEIEVEEKENE